jgi:hypothetical protein
MLTLRLPLTRCFRHSTADGGGEDAASGLEKV